MMPRPPRPSSQLFREEQGLKRRQLRRERLLRGALAALAVAAALLQGTAAPPAAESPPSASAPSAVAAAGHRLGSSTLPPSFGDGAEGYFPRGCVWRSARERRAAVEEGAGSSSSSSRGSVSREPPPPLEFYLEESESWTLEMPPECTIAGDPKLRGGGGGRKQAAKKKKNKKKRTETTKASDPFPFPLSSTSQSCDALACTYRGGLWISGRGRWHSIIEGGAIGGSAAATGGRIPAAGKISRNLRLAPLRVAGSAAASAVAAASPEKGAHSSLRLVAGRTLVLDFGFYRHPSAIGHWAEAAGQLASHVFAEETRRRSERDSDSDDESESEKLRFDHRFDRVVLLHVSRRHFGEWARAALAAALGVGPGEPSLPPIYFQQGVESLSDLRPPPSSSSSSFYSPPTIEQREVPTRARLEGISVGDWLVFEDVTIVRDAATGGPRFAAPAAAARSWRRRFFELHGVPVPEEQQEQQQQQQGQQQQLPPKTVLYLRKREDRRVLNEAALLEALRSRLGARVVATDFLSSSSSSSPPFSSPVPVREQLLLLSRADVLLSAHTSALAGALFLRQRTRTRRRRPSGGRAESEEEPGAAVVELLQSNWGGWGSLDESFRALTSSFDDDEGGNFKSLRHGSWRATRRRHGAYPNRRDGARFGSWGGSDGDGDGGGDSDSDDNNNSGRNKRKNLCASEACVEAHTRVDLIADIEAVTELVGRALRGEEVGWGVESKG